METSSHSRLRARTLRPASRSNDQMLLPHLHNRCRHRSCAPHKSAPGGGRDARSQRARNLRQTISFSSTIFSTDTIERVVCFSRGQSSTWMVRTSPTLGPLIKARAPRESGSQLRRYHGVVEENAHKCESERAQRARFRHRPTRQAIVERQFTVRNSELHFYTASTQRADSSRIA